ncbi:unnamed protein product [Mycena citricolor]|uniref:DUF6534 domain-containing protein n=1 Tax=Mycena citricolor TaxID=2018698 RepID=A0AAD2JXE9_9AGAR|nr:unnamed protein product [Mycena citricolor]
MPGAMTARVSLADTLGAILMGVIFSALIYGISSLHGFFYLHKFHHYDPWLLKAAVGSIWLLDTLHLVFAIWAIFFYTVFCFGKPAALLEIHWAAKVGSRYSRAKVTLNLRFQDSRRLERGSSMLRATAETVSDSAFQVVIVLLVQVFYVYRVWRLSGLKKRGVVSIAIVAVLCGAAFGLLLAVKTVQASSFLELSRPDLSVATQASFAVATAVDFAIAGTMCYYLYSSKRVIPRIRGSRLHVAINTVIHYTICSGLLTSVTSLACLITFITLPRTLIFFALSFILTKCYVFSLFTLLNLRRGKSLTPDATRQAGESSNSYSMGYRRNGTTHHLDTMHDRPVVVGVHVDVERGIDPVLDINGNLKASTDW